MHKLFSDEKGSAIVLFAVVCTLLMGLSALVIDYGRMYYVRSDLQNAVDAAALAGARDLLDDTTGAAAVDTAAGTNGYLAKNGVKSPDTYSAVVVRDDNTYAQTIYDGEGNPHTIIPDTITVRATRNVPFNFARIFGQQSSNVTAVAAAGTLPLEAGKGVLPIGVPEEKIPRDADGNPVMVGEVDLVSHQSWEPGDFGWLDLDGDNAGGEPEIKNRITNGYPEFVRTGEHKPPETGWMTPVYTALATRINSCPHSPQCTIDNYENPCPRLVIVPLIENWTGGQGQVEVLGFAALLLSDLEVGTGSDKFINVKASWVEAPMLVSGSGGYSAEETGVYGVKMLK